MTRQTVDNRRKARRLVAVPTGRHGYSYPSWQFDEKVLPMLEDVLAALPAHTNEWALLTFFLNGNGYLGGKRPLDVMRAGRKDDAVRAAMSYATQGLA